MRFHQLALAGALLLGVALVAVAETDTAKLLVGVWELTKGEDAPPGATVEFTRDGKMKMRAKVGEKDLAIDGTYKVEGKSIATALSFGGKIKKETSKIKTLTKTEL